MFLLFSFAVLKVVFLLVHYQNFEEKTFSHVLQSFTKPFRLDVASASYLMVIPILLFIIQSFFRRQFIDNLNFIYFSFVTLFITVVNLIDIELYTHWQTKINFKAFMFMNEPSQIAGAAGNEALVKMTVFTIVLFLLLFGIYKKFIFKPYKNVKTGFFKSILSLIVLATFTTLGIRGGMQQIPVNQSDAYYSDNPTLNYAGVNSVWNLGNTIFQNKKYLNTNPYKKMGVSDAESIVKSLFHTEKDTTQYLLDTIRPNIVFVALEGFNANVIFDFDASVNYAPNIQKFIENGYSFTKMYSSGLRTDQGLVSVLSGFPALPLQTIGAQPEKFQKLPSLSKTLIDAGYECAFHFGGEPEFGSFKSFLIQNKFSKIVDFRDFPKQQLTQKLGAPDEYLFQKHLQDVEKLKEPFFSLIMTQTTHEPFDIPINANISNAKQKYLNTIVYTDSVLGWWMLEMEKLPFYDNTIFIFSADHGHRFPGEYWYSDNKRFHIPFIFYGKPLKEDFRGEKFHKLAAQTDIPKTLLAQLQLPHTGFDWSKDLLNPYSPEFSFYIFINGFVWQKPNYSCAYEYNYNKIEFCSDSINLNTCNKKGQAYMQHLFETYLKY